MFSNPPPDNIMSYPDYKQTAQDHSSILILVQHIGKQLNPKVFRKVFDKISKLKHITVQDPQSGSQRTIWIRYRRVYPVENNEWGDFQAHRKVLGLISIGKCSSQEEMVTLCEQHANVQANYLTTLYDSRCIAIGAHAVPAHGATTGPLKLEPSDASILLDGKVHPRRQGSDVSMDRDSGVFDAQNPDAVECPSPKKTESGSHAVQYLDLAGPQVIDNASDDLASPGDPKSDDSSSATQTSNSQKSDDSSSSYVPRPFVAPQSLKTTVLSYPSEDDCPQLDQDLYDFICSLFWVLESKRLDRSHEKLDRLPLLCAPFEKKGFVGIDMDSRTNKKRCVGRMKKHVGDLCLLAGLAKEAITYYTAAIDYLKYASDWLWLGGCYEGLNSSSVVLMFPLQLKPALLQRNASFSLGSRHIARPKSSVNLATRSLPNGIEPSDYKSKNCLSIDEITEKYREAIDHYRKYRAACMIEIEANMKAAQVLIQQEKYLRASEFLQNAFSITRQLPEDEKIHHVMALAELYEQIGFHRKSAFLKRIAAMRCISPQTSNPDWSQCYHLLLQTLEGYNLCLDPKLFSKDCMQGWPVIQIQILLELVGTSRRIGNVALSIRHMTFLLHAMLDHLSPVEKQEFCSQLEALTARCEGAPVPLALDNGVIIPAVNLLNIPKVKSFVLQSPAPHLRPVMLKSQLVERVTGPFIFSPLQLGNNREKKNGNKMDFQWVEGDVCEVALQIYNPMPFELKVGHMGLLADGIAFETFPSCLSLPAESGPYTVKLLGTPRNSGDLEILGYTTHVLGVKSNCRLHDLSCSRKDSFVVTVVPALPQIQVVTSLPKSPIDHATAAGSDAIATSAYMSAFAGECRECTVTITNTGKENVEEIDVTAETKLEKELEGEFCTWSNENLKAQLPFLAESSASFTLYVNVMVDFSTTSDSNIDEVSEASSISAMQSKPSSSRVTALSSISSAFSSLSHSLLGSIPEDLPPPILSYQSKTVECILKLRYTGGPGQKKGLSRIYCVALVVEVSPSLIIAKWDVLPGESPNMCYLVLDILNATDHEMEVQYTVNKRILIEARDTCRIPVPVERCPLSKLADLKEEEVEVVCRQHIANLVDLRWSIVGTETKGRTSLSSLSWNSDMLDMIRMSPIQWEISLNERLFRPEEEFSFCVGDLVNVSITIFNYSDVSLSDFYLSVQCYQDFQNGQQNYRLDGKVAAVGCDKVSIVQIVKQDCYHHQCSLVFFFPGIYKLDVQCDGDNVRRPSSVQANCSVPLGFSSLTHKWRCTPAIEITIVE